MSMSVFRDRTEAGERLAQALERWAGEDVIVLALPRGGVEVALPVAERLGAPLDVLVSRKLGAPMQPELGFGAVSEGGAIWVDEEATRALGLGPQVIEAIESREREELQRRVRAYRGGRPLNLEGRTVLLVDDGVATGGTMRAAIRAARALGAARVIVAVPVAAPESAAEIRREVDEWVCLQEPSELWAIGVWYRSFPQLDDDRVLEMLGGGKPLESLPPHPPTS